MLDYLKWRGDLPFTAAPQGVSRTDWLNLIRGLRECGFSGTLILDLADTARAFLSHEAVDRYAPGGLWQGNV